MTNITVRKDHPAVPTTDPWERLMRNFFGWDPFREMQPYAAVDRAFAPAFEIKETKEGYLFRADMPGVKEGDVECMITGNRLTIKGKREDERKQENETYYCYERSYGSFTRAFTLPDGVDAARVHAELKDGVLTLLVPKMPEAQPKKIDVKGAK